MQHSTVAAGAVLATGFAASADEPPAKAIIDCHTHFYNPERPGGIPWPGKDDKVLYKKTMPEDFAAFAKKLGVTGTVIVEASPLLEDNQWILDLCKDQSFVVGVVGHLNPGTPEFAGHIKRFAANKYFRGIRVNQEPLKKGLADDKFVADIKLLADNDLELDINGGPTGLPGIAAIGEKIPALRIVINHEGNLKIDGKEPPADWAQNMQTCAKNKNIACKVSALVSGTGKGDGTAPSDVAFYKPVLDTLWATFGEDRLIYGSDWPVSARFAPYDRVLSIVGQYFKDKGQAAADKYFALNAKAIYKYV